MARVIVWCCCSARHRGMLLKNGKLIIRSMKQSSLSKRALSLTFVSRTSELTVLIFSTMAGIVRSLISRISVCSCIIWALISDISGGTFAVKSRLDGLLVVGRGYVDLLVMFLYSVPDLSRASLTNSFDGR